MSNVLSYNGYHAAIEFSVEDNLLVGTVLGIQDVLCFHGSTIEEVTQYFHSCIDDYLDFCQRTGKTPEKEYKGSFNVRLSPELHRRADIAARMQGMTLNQFMVGAVENMLTPRV